MILSLTLKELQLLRHDLHGVAVLFLMPTAFVLIMSLAIPTSQEIEQRQFNVKLEATAENVYQELFEAFFARDVKLRMVDSADEVDFSVTLLSEFDAQNLDKIQVTIATNSDQLEQVLIQESVQSALAKVKLRDVLMDMEVIDEEDSIEAQVNAIESETELVPLNISGSNSLAIPTAVQQSVPSWLIFGMFFIVLPFAQTFIKEKQNSTIMRLRSFGLRPGDFIVSKLLPFFIINQIQYYLLIAVGYFVVPLLGGEAFRLYGAWANYVILGVFISAMALGLACFIAVVVRTQEQAVVIGGGINLILAAIGGIMVPKHLMSDKIQAITNFSPMGWGLDTFKALLLEGRGLTEILTALLVMITFSSIMLGLAIFAFSRQFRNLGWNSAS